MKPERTSTVPNYPWTVADTLPSPSDAENTEQCLIWQLKSIALEYIPELAHLKPLLESCPEIDQIQLHKTEQFPLSAMHEDESTLEGTITVINKLFEQLKASSSDLEDHGLVFANGDLLTDNLVNTVLLRVHVAIAPILLKACSRSYGGLDFPRQDGGELSRRERALGKAQCYHSGWSLLGAYSTVAAKADLCWLEVEKSTPWKPCHATLQISSAGHVHDAFRIHCGEASFPEWAAKASFGDFVAVSGKVYSSLYTTAAYDDACARNEATRDAAFENSAGDIGRVILVFRWAVMMRSPKTMPKYADAFFETLNRIKTYDPVLQKFFLHNWLVNITGIINRFKEVDLLQEHQNFWAKIVYNAKGTVHATFKIPDYGTKHTVPDMQNEILRVAEALQKDHIRSCGPTGLGRIKFLVPPGSNMEGANDTTALDEENTRRIMR
ncbi:hypothetical protein B0H14DRAFT_2659380 [Mycena olivaceomarginata]|nr:hypothetical protein B0H14DRAFT_2659380 [Mycena olivaceomarginata]